MGFMAITKDVNVHLLNECFELRPFHGLCKPHPDDELDPPAPLDDIDENEEASSNLDKLSINTLICYSLTKIFFSASSKA